MYLEGKPLKEIIMVEIWYEDGQDEPIKIGEILTNNISTVDEALEFIGFNENEWINEHGWYGFDYNCVCLKPV